MWFVLPVWDGSLSCNDTSNIPKSCACLVRVNKIKPAIQHLSQMEVSPKWGIDTQTLHSSVAVLSMIAKHLFSAIWHGHQQSNLAEQITGLPACLCVSSPVRGSVPLEKLFSRRSEARLLHDEGIKTICVLWTGLGCTWAKFKGSEVSKAARTETQRRPYVLLLPQK